jgi:hypothetical protein
MLVALFVMPSLISKIEFGDKCDENPIILRN